jgi:hypothetical protein
MVGAPLQEWKPLRLWQKLGNMSLPLSAGISSDTSGMTFARKLTLANPITAMIWNNASSTVDANHDTIVGGELLRTKASLTGYTDVFTGMAVSKNITQGYGLPIMDPWTQRDLKSGINFGPSALSVISVGFGGPGAPVVGQTYQSLFDQYGKFTGSATYASVWSGALVFTEAQQIRDYKLFRTATGQDWSGTQLALVGAPFMVTHGVKSVSRLAANSWVLGGPDELYTQDDQNLNPAFKAGTVKVKHGCADCHAKGAEFFTGGFEMLGPAVPASVSYDPTAQLQLNPDGSLVLNANGDPIRNPGYFLPAHPDTPWLNTGFMERPLEQIRVKAFPGDMETEFEGFNKLGQPRNTTYMERSTNGLYDVSVPIQRADVLYPKETVGDTAVEAKIYYKISDWNAAGTALLAGHDAPMNGREYAAYLETLDKPLSTATAFIESIAGTPAHVPATGTNGEAHNGLQIHVAQSVSVPLVAKVTGNGPATTYTWKFSDGSADLTEATATKTFALDGITVTELNWTKTFATAGAVTVTLTAADPNGARVVTADGSLGALRVQSVDTQNVFVDAPGPATSTWAAVAAAPVAGVTVFTTSGAAPATTTKVRVAWGDGSYEEFASIGATVGHAYKQLPAYWNNANILADITKPTGATLAAVNNVYSYQAKVYFYNGKVLLDSKGIIVRNAPTSDLVLSARMSRAYDKLTNTYTVRKGTNVSLIYYVYNDGPADNANIVVNAPAGAHFTPVSYATSSPADTFVTGTWTIASLKKGQTATLTVKVTVGLTNTTFTDPTFVSATNGDAVANVTNTYNVVVNGADSTAIIGGTYPGTISAIVPVTAPHSGAITVIMPYTGNQNNNNSFSVKYKLHAETSYKYLALVGHQPANNPDLPNYPGPSVTFTPTDAITGQPIYGTYDIVVTYNDPAAVYLTNHGGLTNGGAVQSTSITTN